MVDSETRSHTDDHSRLQGHHPHHHGHQGGVIGVVSGLGHALEDAFIASSRKHQQMTGEDMTPEERHWRHVAEEERKRREFSPEIATDAKVNPNPTASDDKTKSTGQPFIAHLTHSWPEPDSKYFVGSNPKAVPNTQKEMEKLGSKMEKEGRQPLKKDISQPAVPTSGGSVTGSGDQSTILEERPALSEFDRALDKLTGIYNNAHFMAEDIHSHPELARKHVRRHKSESEPKTSEQQFEEALDKISSAYGSSNIRMEERDFFKTHPHERPERPRRLSEQGDAREQFDQALDKLTAPFNSTRIVSEDVFSAKATPTVEPRKSRSRQTSENKDYFEDAMHKLTAVFGSTALQADDVQHIIEEEAHKKVEAPPPAPPAEEHSRTPLDDALDRLQGSLHKGIHLEDLPRYHWPEVRDEPKGGNAHPITDAVKDMMDKGKDMVEKGAEKGKQMVEQGIEKGKEMIPDVGTTAKKSEPNHETYAHAADAREDEAKRRAVESIKKHTQPVNAPYESAHEIERKSELARQGMSTGNTGVTEGAKGQIIGTPRNTDVDPKTFLVGNQKVEVAHPSEHRQAR